MIVVVDEDTNAPSKESNDEKPVVSEPVSTPGESGIPQVEAINGANGSASPDPANGDSEDNDKENVESGNEAILDPFNNVDEMLRRMDEIDPGHKLRSLCKKGDAGALTEFLKEDVDLVRFIYKLPYSKYTGCIKDFVLPTKGILISGKSQSLTMIQLLPKSKSHF